MTSKFTALQSLTIKESRKIFRCWAQTLLPSAVTTTLYFVIFGNLIGQRIGLIHDLPYNQFIAPGLIMLTVITTSYAQVCGGVYLAKFARYIEEILVSPMSDSMIVTGFMLSGLTRGFLAGVVVTFIASLFVPLPFLHPLILLGVVILTSVMFSLTGFLNGLYANSFDEISIIPTFVLTPLTYLGGVFYSVSMLPDMWEKLSHINPILYMVNTFRYGMIGITDVPIYEAMALLLAINLCLFFACISCLKHSSRVRP